MPMSNSSIGSVHRAVLQISTSTPLRALEPQAARPAGDAGVPAPLPRGSVRFRLPHSSKVTAPVHGARKS